MYRPLLIAFLILFPGWVQLSAQTDSTPSPEVFGLAHLSEYLNLRPDDIAFRSDYTPPDSLRLKAVAELMRHPLDMIEYARGLKDAYSPGQPEILTQILYRELAGQYQSDRLKAYRPSGAELQNRYNLYYTDFTLNQLLSRMANYLDVIFPRSAELAMGGIAKSQKRFLAHEFKELLVMRTEEEHYTPEALDSVEKAEDAYADRFASFGTLFSADPLVDAGADCLRELLLQLKSLQSQIASGEFRPDEVMSKTVILSDNVDQSSYLGRQPGWRVGGTGNDYYRGDYRFILDFGGDDVYDLTYDPDQPHGVIIIDLSGDDVYRAGSDFGLASGCFSVGLLLDMAGDDRYDGGSFGLGSGYFGLGVLYDAGGNDVYTGDTHVEGAGTCGMGLLIDEAGRDIYDAAVYSQGFGFVRGIGMIHDRQGADSYYAGGKYKDFLRYEDHYLSMSQGFGLGFRPTLSGGIGAIVDLKGNDTYNADIFAQACSYWWSLGVIYDSSGNDNYQCFQYGQGAATHMTLGALIDDTGNDVYFGKGLMQGCGHDYSCGLLLDRTGNDTYTAYDLSQAAGSANGVGVLIDNSGADRYFVKNPANTQGYGNPRRQFGSIGLFIDLGGSDQYDGNGHNNFYWRTPSKWGGGMDIELYPVDSTEAQP